MKIQLTNLIKSIIQSPVYLIRSIYAHFFTRYWSNEEGLKEAYSYLYNAQDAQNDGGFSRGYYLYKKFGWDASYTETTGYILETLIVKLNKQYSENIYNRINLSVEYLLNKQSPQGYFRCIDNKLPQVFDTGQVLYGLLAYYKNEKKYSHDKNIKAVELSIQKACNWLTDVQDLNGSWSKYGYRSIPHSYYTRVASILFEAGAIFSNLQWIKSAEKYFAWLLNNIDKNGNIEKLNFEKNEVGNLSHSMMYVIEGLCHYSDISGNKYFYQIAEKYYDNISKKITTGIVIQGRYSINLDPINHFVCLTGVAQYLNIGLRWMSESDKYRSKLISAALYLKHHQIKFGPAKGGFWGSVPLWGEYASFRAPNWAVKFYIDAMEQYKLLEISQDVEIDNWVKESFNNYPNKIITNFTSYSNFYLNELIKLNISNKYIFEIGAGSGRFLKVLSEHGSICSGVDPVVSNEFVKIGSLSNINIEDLKNQDIILFIETLQHIYNPRQDLLRIKSVLKKGGCIIIFERKADYFTLFYKNIMQLMGRWMYKWDSPFKECWRTERQWCDMFAGSGLIVDDIKIIRTGSLFSRVFQSRLMLTVRRS